MKDYFSTYTYNFRITSYTQLVKNIKRFYRIPDEKKKMICLFIYFIWPAIIFLFFLSHWEACEGL